MTSTIANVPRKKAQAGVTLIELMVSLVIGSLLIAGAITVYVQSRGTYRVTETAARLQEVARYALDTIDADVRMAGYWGLTNRADFIENAAGASDAVRTEGSITGTCGQNWPLDVTRFADGRDGMDSGNPTGTGYNLACPAGTDENPADFAVPAADVLIVRRASSDTRALANNKLQIQTNRMRGVIFRDGTLPAGFTAAPSSETRDLVVHAYYINNAGANANGNTIFQLRRKTLTTGPAIDDEEIISGVDDLQVQFGIDSNGDGNADKYVNPGAVPATALVTSARIWIRVVAEDFEAGFQDPTSYAYANATPGALTDGRRRVLLSKTIKIRNSRP